MTMSVCDGHRVPLSLADDVRRREHRGHDRQGVGSPKPYLLGAVTGSPSARTVGDAWGIFPFIWSGVMSLDECGGRRTHPGVITVTGT